MQGVVPDVAHVLPSLHDAHVDGVAQLHVLTLVQALLANEDFLGSNEIRGTVDERKMGISRWTHGAMNAQAANLWPVNADWVLLGIHRNNCLYSKVDGDVYDG